MGWFFNREQSIGKGVQDSGLTARGANGARNDGRSEWTWQRNGRTTPVPTRGDSHGTGFFRSRR